MVELHCFMSVTFKQSQLIKILRETVKGENYEEYRLKNLASHARLENGMSAVSQCRK